MMTNTNQEDTMSATKTTYTITASDPTPTKYDVAGGVSVEIFGKTVTTAAEALIALRGACSTSTDDDGVTYIWAGYLSGQEPGDGTRECEMLVAAGILERDTNEEYYVYRVLDDVEDDEDEDEDISDCYIMTCASGAIVLVSAESARQAEEAWDANVEADDAEPRVTEASPATRAAVEACVHTGHDYR